ncbi:hypothetical protein ABZP36_007450 [Zizania latifolia]
MLLEVAGDKLEGWTIFEILPEHNWSAYEEALKTNPVLTKMMISGVIYSLGDWIAQCYEASQSLSSTVLGCSAIATVVTVAEILKNNGFAVERKIRTSTVEINDESRVRPLQKAKIEIVLGKSDKFDELMAAAAEEREAEEQA